MSLLPNDLLVQILLRLPVKYLLRFKCVSKSWLSLISDPHFAISHYELAAARTHRLMYLETYTLGTHSLDLDAPHHNDLASAAITLDRRLPKHSSFAYILGSCRGFLLLSSSYPYSYLYLWNPSTGALKKLPISPSAYPCFYGFGYDPSTDDYLVVHASSNSSASDRVAHFKFFFSLRLNSWEKIEGPCLLYSDGGIDPNVGLLLNGALHWYAVSKDLQMIVIIAFDLVEKRLSEIPLPYDYKCPHDPDHLWVHGGFLSVCVLDSEFRASIWVMKEYKVQSSWTKSIIVSIYDIYTVLYSFPMYFFPVCSTESGDIYGKNSWGEWVKCNAKGELLEHCSYPLGLGSKEARYIHSHAAMYTESLLPLPGDDNGQVKMIDNNKQELACEFFSTTFSTFLLFILMKLLWDTIVVDASERE